MIERERTHDELQIERVLFERRREGKRFAQDTPIVPGVWRAYVAHREDDGRVDLILAPEAGVDPVVLARALIDRLEGYSTDGPAAARVAYTSSFVVARLRFSELVNAAMPLTAWWRDRTQKQGEWIEEVITTVEHLAAPDEPEALAQRNSAGERQVKPPAERPLLSLVTLNRRVETAVVASRRTVKADAAQEVFGLDTTDLRWAVIDDGIDARHPAFRRSGPKGKRYGTPFRGGNRTRVIATYDFTLLREAQSIALSGKAPQGSRAAKLAAEHGDALVALGSDLSRERPIDWKLVAPMLEVPHTDKGYQPPLKDHGTHVAGILAADWDSNEGPRRGVCPTLELYDLRVFDENGDGDEFVVTAALQFVDYLNGFGRKIVVQGANVSLSVHYEFDVFACGQTPVCREADRLAGAGVVVVAAAGNQGVSEFVSGAGVKTEGYRSISLTDPGNANDVITVGATHRSNPHAYGVSYFSSRGPTGDGRRKPDIVAPGERIWGPLRDGGWGELDGTSQAAAHVSGAAALLLGRHRELIGRPEEIKRILCCTATDLGRERDFQGAGLVDALRALQEV